jgi:hypothetical protein
VKLYQNERCCVELHVIIEVLLQSESKCINNNRINCIISVAWETWVNQILLKIITCKYMQNSNTSNILCCDK